MNLEKFMNNLNLEKNEKLLDHVMGTPNTKHDLPCVHTTYTQNPQH